MEFERLLRLQDESLQAQSNCGITRDATIAETCVAFRSQVLLSMTKAGVVMRTGLGLEQEPTLGANETGPFLLPRAQRVREDLVALKDLFFSDRDGIRVNRGPIDRALKNLDQAIAMHLPAEDLFFDLACQIREHYPFPCTDTDLIDAVKVLCSLAEWEFRNTGAFSEELKDCSLAPLLLGKISRGEPIRFVFFVCPPAHFSALPHEFPEQYFGTYVEGSLLEGQREKLKMLTRLLDCTGVPYQITAVIGDTDEMDYLWPILGNPERLEEEKVLPRKQEYEEAVRNYLTGKKIISAERLVVTRLSALKPSFRACNTYNNFAATWNPSTVFTETDIEEEIQRMKNLWEPSSYYDGLPAPSNEALRRIVLAKFTAYAEEGVLLQSIDESRDSILLQAELPPLLRTRMLSAGRELMGMQSWPAVLMNPTKSSSQ